MIMLLVLAIYFLKKTNNRVVKSLMMFLLVFMAVAGAFIFENLQTVHVAKAVESVKQWIQSPATTTSSMPEEKNHVSIIPIKDSVLLDSPVVTQMPELPRGCEVTSLAMLLKYAGIEADKLKLAEEVKKNSTEFKLANGKIYFGDPNEGFVGNMYTYSEPGLGVYHKPVKELAEKYLPGQIKDLTGIDFQELKIHLSDNRPVWVIINTQYKKLDESSFETWFTPTGTVRVTFKEHSVLITGYDQKYIYFNDPLTGEKNKKAPMNDFEESWVQMGRQAITYLLN